MIMSADYIKQLEDALERAQSRLESELMGKAIINRSVSADTIGQMNPDTDDDIIEGSITVGCVVFAKIKKEKNGWAGYILEWNEKRRAYTHQKYVIGKETFDDTVKKCISMMALDIETTMKVYSVIKGVR